MESQSSGIKVSILMALTWENISPWTTRATEIRQMFSYQEPLTRDNCSNIKGPWNKTNVLVSRALKWYNCFHIKGPEMIQLFSYQGRLTCDNSSKIKGPEMIQKFSNQGPWNDAKGSQIKGPEIIQLFSYQGFLTCDHCFKFKSLPKTTIGFISRAPHKCSGIELEHKC